MLNIDAVTLRPDKVEQNVCLLKKDFNEFSKQLFEFIKEYEKVNNVEK